MESRFGCIVIALQVILVISLGGGVACRPLSSNHGVNHQPSVTDQRPESSSQVFLGSNHVFDMKSKQGNEGKDERGRAEEGEAYPKGLSKIGSTPPSCDHKCFGCTPCEAVQVPTTKTHNHFGVNYANYEPEGWKCKCGPSLYSP